ncbi:carbohydrate ABC transporter permease, partial [Candidatus Sumerlaeota bacterium]|nr:carbohydrate ABC transporter permease [Candidatus Sumerlaeota bacterium]
MKRNLTLFLVYSMLLLVTVIMLTPMVWLIAAAFKGKEDLFHYLFFSPNPTLNNFRLLFREIPFFRFLMNSFFVSGMCVMTRLFFSSLGGFALAKYEFRGKKAVMTLMLATMMIPGQVMLGPLYELIYHLKLMDSLWGLIIPGMVGVFGIFLFRQSMLHIPDDLLDAGRIDGCNEFRIYWNIILPVSKPMIGAFCLIAFMG